MMKKGRSTPKKEKTTLVDKLANMIDKNEIIGIVDMENLPAKQLNNMRAQLRGKVDIIMTKRRIMTLALQKSKKDNISKMTEYLSGMPAFIFTNTNPFALFKLLKKNMSTTAIKAGQKAPQDIIVPAGPTGFSPGPIIGELGGFKIKAGIDGGKVAIKEDAQVAKEGDIIGGKLAGLLARLGIEPMLIGLNLKAVYENGNILRKDVLDIDEDAFMASLQSAASEAFNLAVFVAFPTKDTIQTLLSKAHNESVALARAQDIMTSENLSEILAKADAQANALKAKIPE